MFTVVQWASLRTGTEIAHDADYRYQHKVYSK